MTKPPKGNPKWGIGKAQAMHPIETVRDAILTTKRRAGDPFVVVAENNPHAPISSIDRELVIIKEQKRCCACLKLLECSKISGPGVKYSQVWLCKKCWKAENQQRRNYNQRNGLFHGNPDRLLCHRWPNKRKIVKTTLFVRELLK